MSVTGVLGEEITIKCSHINAFSNVKYFCKGTCENEDILISSREKKTNERYSISDQGNTFYVTISHLTEDDSGTYWCGIDRLGLNTHNKVVLTVIEGELIQRRVRIAFMTLLFFITYRIKAFVPFSFLSGNTKDPEDDLPQSISNNNNDTTASSSSKQLSGCVEICTCVSDEVLIDISSLKHVVVSFREAGVYRSWSRGGSAGSGHSPFNILQTSKQRHQRMFWYETNINSEYFQNMIAV